MKVKKRKDLRDKSKKTSPSYVDQRVFTSDQYGSIWLPYNVTNPAAQNSAYSPENTVFAAQLEDRDVDQDTFKDDAGENDSFKRVSPKHLPPRMDLRKHRTDEEDDDLKLASVLPEFKNYFMSLLKRRKDGKQPVKRSDFRTLATKLDRKYNLRKIGPESDHAVDFLKWLIYLEGTIGKDFAEYLLGEFWGKKTNALTWVKKYHPDYKYAKVENMTTETGSWKNKVASLQASILNTLNNMPEPTNDFSKSVVKNLVQANACLQVAKNCDLNDIISANRTDIESVRKVAAYGTKKAYDSLVQAYQMIRKARTSKTAAKKQSEMEIKNIIASAREVLENTL